MGEQISAGATPVVLVIDDDDQLRSTLAEMLEDEGLNVITARDGDRGLAELDRHQVNVVVTDILMPGKGGNEIIHNIRNKSPGIGIIAMSGGGQTGTMDFLDIAKKQGSDHVLQKPFDMDELAELVRQLLAVR